MNLFKRLLAATGAAGLLIGVGGTIPALGIYLAPFTATLGSDCVIPGQTETITVHSNLGAPAVAHIDWVVGSSTVSGTSDTGLIGANGTFTDQVTVPTVTTATGGTASIWLVTGYGVANGAFDFGVANLCPSPASPTLSGTYLDVTEVGGTVNKTCAPGLSGEAVFSPTIEVKVDGSSQTTIALPASLSLHLTCNGESQPLPKLPPTSVITLHESTAPSGAEPARDTSITIGSQPGTTTINNALADKITVTPDSGIAISAVEGSNVEQMVGTFTDTGRPGGGACNTEDYVATINWGDGSTSTGTVSCERDASSDHVPTGVFDVNGRHRYADSGSYDVTLSVVDNSESGESSGAAVKTDAATISDAALGTVSDNSDDGSYSAVEGKSLAVSVVFADSRGFGSDQSRDASITGTINWGDGTVQTVAPVASTAPCECIDPFAISGSHVYDAAAANYHITVTAADDGGQTAVARFSARISDGTLTADANKSLSGVATTALTNVVGSFVDGAGAQAAVADFAATIDWGDGSATSTGTLSQTASGAFSVSGTHTYASAGSKSITATVTDEEGSTVTLHATATIAAAPIVLPATGQPRPGGPIALLVLLALLLVGGTTLAVGARFLGNIRATSR